MHSSERGTCVCARDKMRCEGWGEESRVRGQADLLRSLFFFFPPYVPKETDSPTLSIPRCVEKFV